MTAPLITDSMVTRQISRGAWLCGSCVHVRQGQRGGTSEGRVFVVVVVIFNVYFRLP